ncbi:MAG: hypothetical protein ACKO9Q_11275, partial [Pirellula sp.]
MLHRRDPKSRLISGGRLRRLGFMNCPFTSGPVRFRFPFLERVLFSRVPMSMTLSPENLKYLPSHEWGFAPQDGSGVATVGISAFAVAELNDLVYMALPKVGQSV